MAERGPSTQHEHAVSILFEALQLTGEDTSGYDGWRHWSDMRTLPQMAHELREAVRQLRTECDEADERPLTAEEHDELVPRGFP